MHRQRRAGLIKSYNITMPDEPQKRYSHIAVRLEHCILVLGGMSRYQSRVERPLPQSVIWMYNLYAEQWRKYVLADGKKHPSTTFDASATVIGSEMYLFGGKYVKGGKKSNAL